MLAKFQPPLLYLPNDNMLEPMQLSLVLENGLVMFLPTESVVFG